uniref:helix-turn-helix domain-containing protein n=3 Tax=Thermus oshimai TaxID=56957 RepID=UPI000375FBA7
MTVADHLTFQELKERVKKEKDPVARLRFLAVYHAKRGLGAREIAELTGHTPRWVHATVKRYNEGGPGALADFRHRNPGAKPKLTP